MVAKTRTIGLSVNGAPVTAEVVALEQQGFDTADDEEGEGGVAVHDPDPLVIDGRDPGPDPGLGRWAAEDRGLRAFGGGGHSRLSSQMMRSSISASVSARSGI